MIEFLVSWAEQLIVALIIIVVVEMILPSQSSYKKYIKIIGINIEMQAHTYYNTHRI